MENIQVENLVKEYAAALNAGNTGLIPTFYTEDGVFMPENTRSLIKSDLLNKSKGFFQKCRFQISYSIQEVVVKGENAFVQAIAQTDTVNPQSNQKISKTSQDFFVLRKEQNDWKIFRYIFNNVKVQ